MSSEFVPGPPVEWAAGAASGSIQLPALAKPLGIAPMDPNPTQILEGGQGSRFHRVSRRIGSPPVALRRPDPGPFHRGRPAKLLMGEFRAAGHRHRRPPRRLACACTMRSGGKDLEASL